MAELKTPAGQPALKMPSKAEVKQKLAEVDTFLQKLIFKRFIGTFIDLVMITVPAVIITLPAFFLLPQKPVNLAAAFNFLIFLAAGIAVLVKDTPFQLGPLDGQTPGKKAMNIRVTTLVGRPITMGMSIRRNIIPALPLLVSAISAAIYIVPIPFLSEIASMVIVLPLFLISLLANFFEIYKIHTGDQNRRWGDTLAGTVVKHD
jgi:uncharacterized RDD family membrane protein YckC